ELRTGEAVTYGELDSLIARCAGFLRRMIAEPRGARVATLARNSLDAVVLLLACERVGAIYTPLNWRLSPVEVAGLVADCEPAFVLWDSEFEAAAAAFQGIASVVQEPGGAAFREAILASEPARPAPAAPDDPAIILYTSGTT